MSSYYVEYIIFLSVIVGHTVLFLGKRRCPLSTVRVIGCPVDDMTFATSPLNFLFLNIMTLFSKGSPSVFVQRQVILMMISFYINFGLGKTLLHLNLV